MDSGNNSNNNNNSDYSGPSTQGRPISRLEQLAQPRQTRSVTGTLPPGSRNELLARRVRSSNSQSGLRQQTHVPVSTGQPTNMEQEPTQVHNNDRNKIQKKGSQDMTENRIRALCNTEAAPIVASISHLEERINNQPEHQVLQMELQELRAAIQALQNPTGPDPTLVNDVRTIRSDLNRLLEERSTSVQQDPQVEQQVPSSVDSRESQEPKEDPLENLPSRNMQSAVRFVPSHSHKSRRSVRNSQSKYTGSRGRHHSDTESDSSNEERSTYKDQDTSDSDGDESTIPFFSRVKGPKHGSLKSIKPSDVLFDRLMNYRYYRLKRTKGSRSSKHILEVRKHLKSLDITLKEYKFNGQDPILVFDFLSRFVEQADTLRMTEMQAFVALPHYLSGTAENQFRAIRNGARSGGVTCWSEAVQYFLRTYATPSAIREAVNHLRDIRQLPKETELEYSARLNNAAYRCGNVYDETDKMTFFINGLSPTIRNIVARHRESQPRRSLTYEELVQFARDEGESHRASNSSLRVVRTVNRTSTDHGTHYLDTGHSSRNEKSRGQW